VMAPVLRTTVTMWSTAGTHRGGTNTCTARARRGALVAVDAGPSSAPRRAPGRACGSWWEAKESGGS